MNLRRRHRRALLVVLALVVCACTTGTARAATPQLDGGGVFSMALKANGTVWTWGDNYWGQLGNGTNTASATPVQVSGLSNITMIAAGHHTAYALRSDGTVWAWGLNLEGELGNGTTSNRNTPGQVSGLTNVVSIAAASWHAFAIRSDGTLWGWGWNGAGQVGNGSYSNALVPAQVSGLTNVRFAAGGFDHSLAIKHDGTVWAWGSNATYQLGNGTTVGRAVPGQVTGVSGAWTVTASSNGSWGAGGSSGALLQDGRIMTWGGNATGNLGDGTTTARTTPGFVPGMANVSHFSMYNQQSFAVRTDGTLWSWGENGAGQLGLGNYVGPRTSPVQASGTNWSAVNGASTHTIGVKKDCTAHAWGNNDYGQVGVGFAGGTYATPVANVLAVGPCEFPPNVPVSLVQKRNDATTVIPFATWTTDGVSTNVVLEFGISDPDASQTLTPWVEIVTESQSFAAICGVSSADTRTGTAVSATTAGVQVTGRVTITGLAAGTRYKWRACAVDATGKEGPWQATAGTFAFGVDTAAPPAVTTTSAASPTTTAPALSWGGVSDPHSGTAYYQVFRSSASGSLGTQVNTDGATTTTTFVDASATPGIWYYTVRAVDAVGNVQASGNLQVSVQRTAAVTVSSIAPATLAQGRQSVPVTVTGSGFVDGATVTFSGTGITVGSVTFVSGTQLVATVTVAGSAPVGARSATVLNPDATSGSGGTLTITAPAISLALTGLGYGGASSSTALDVGVLLPGEVRTIGPAGSGQAAAGPAVRLDVTSDTDYVVQHGRGGWTGPGSIPSEGLQFRASGTSDPWLDVPATSSTIGASRPPGSASVTLDLRVAVPAGQAGGAYSTTMSYAVVATP